MKLTIVNRKDEKSLAMIFFVEDMKDISQNVFGILTRISVLRNDLSNDLIDINNLKDLNEYDRSYFKKEIQDLRKDVLKQYFRFKRSLLESSGTEVLEDKDCIKMALALKTKFSFFVSSVAPELEVMLPLVEIE